jgi:SPP1 gp7 family putative phage head morphogenesis protein
VDFGNIQIQYKKEELPDAPPADAFAMKTKADSPYFEKYQERPFNTNELYRKQDNYTIYDNMREDDQINAVLTLKKSLIIDSKYEIVVEESDKAEEIKEFLEKNLDEYIDELFDKKLYNILSAKDYGFSLTEKIFGHHDTLWGPRIVLKSLQTRPPHSFREIIQDEFGNIKKIMQDTAMKGLIALDPKKFIHFANMQEFSLPWGRSELNLGVYRAWWSKKQIIKFWNMYLERMGIPPVVGTIPLSLANEKQNLLNAIDNIQAKTGITIPEGVTLELLTDDGTKGESGFERAIDKYNTMIARSMLIPDLTGMSGSETGGGSYSLGQEQIGILFTVIQQDRRQLERLVTKEIIKPLVLWNYGTGYDAKFVFRQVDEKRKVEQSKVYLEAIKTGKVDPNFAQMNHFLNSIDFPEIEEDEWEEMEAKKEEMREAMQDGFNNNDNEKEDNKKADKETGKESKSEDGKQNPDKAKKEEKKEFAKSPYFRDFTIYEVKVNFQKIESDSEALAEEYLPKLNESFALVINGLMADIKGRKIVENKKIEAVNKLKLRNMAKVQKTFNGLYRDSYRAGEASVRTDFAAADASSLDNEDVIEWLTENSIYTSTTEAEEILKIAKGTLFDSIRTGKGIRETMAMLDTALEGWDLTRGGKLDKTLRLETIARTVTAKAYNEARSQQFNELKDVIIGYQFSAIMDGHTSDICTSLDKKIIKPAEIEKYTPPLHYNCRSLIVPIFETEPLDDFDKLPNVKEEKGGFLKLVK